MAEAGYNQFFLNGYAARTVMSRKAYLYSGDDILAFSVEFIRPFDGACELFIQLMEKQGFALMEEKKIDYGVGYKFEKENKIIKAAIYYNKMGNSTKTVFGADISDRALNSVAQALAALSDRPITPAYPAQKDREIKAIPELERHIGTDESGKGDYFGPLVIAGVFVDKRLEKLLAELGANDSKLNSDDKNRRLASDIKAALGREKYEVIKISPQKYNELYQKTGNLNSLLAWGHARVIENLLSRNDCGYIIADQFGGENVLRRALMEKGRRAELIQTPKGERDTAVAAASILAREEYLRAMELLSEQTGLTLIKGASAQVEKRAREIVGRNGAEWLVKVAKLHFKTTERVLKG